MSRYYSAPHHPIGTHVFVRATTTSIELLLDGRRIASHSRNYGPKGSFTTDEAHRPKSHRQWGAWPPQRIIAWASELGPNTGRAVERIITDRPHPEQGYRFCLALISDTKRYPQERVEAACARALQIGAPTRRSIVAILRNNLDQVAPTPDDEQLSLPVEHENVRGADYYATEPLGSDTPMEKHDAGRTDPAEDARHEDERDGRGLRRTPTGSAEQPAELRREGGPHDRPRMDEPRESPPHSSDPRGEAEPRRDAGGRLDDTGTRRDQDRGS